MRFDLASLARDADALDQLCGGDDEQLFHDMLLGETDVDKVVWRIHEQIARDDEILVGIKVRKEALRDREQRITARRDNAKALIGKVLRACHLPKLELPEVTYSVRLGNSTLKVVDPEAVPDELCRVKREPDKTAINDIYDQANELPNWLVRESAKDVVTARTK